MSTNKVNFLLGLLSRGECSVTFLPKKLSGPQERGWMLELPSNDVAPLIEAQWEIAMTLNPFGVGRIHDGFRGRTDGDGLGQLRTATARHPCHFRGEI